MFTITMPCFNEAEGISDFAHEIFFALNNRLDQLIVIDDCSTDDTSVVLRKLSESNPKIVHFRNPVNLGHGPSTLIGIQKALATGSRFVITMDGDGQFLAAEVSLALDAFSKQNPDILEGFRQQRNDPWFRKLVTISLRFFVLACSFKLPKDANTPFRIYRRESLKILLDGVDPRSMTPNLFFSVRSRRHRFDICEFGVTSIQRKGSVKSGVTWESKNDMLPSKRFVLFCLRAGLRLFKFK
jgi:glycosyltransferase involved in cell wall biosynthesis